MKNKQQTIIFDFDGTLSDSLPVFLTAYNKSRRNKHQKPLTADEFRSIGLPKLAEREHLSRWQLFWVVVYARFYAERHKSEFVPFKGIGAQVQKLASRYKLGILTSNSARNVRYFLKKNNLESYFAFVESNLGYFGKAKKLEKVMHTYSLSKRKTLYIGDERRDIDAAKEVGIKGVAVVWGFENKELVSKSRPDLTISKISNLYKLVSNFVH